MDESGCLGFKLNSSRFFSISLLCCNHYDEKKVRNIIKKIRQRKLKKKLKRYSELKANNSEDYIREAVLNKINNLDVEIYAIILNKKKVYEYLKYKKHILYNYIANLILNECSFEGSAVELIVDRRGGNILSQSFTKYIKKKFAERNEGCKIKIKHKNSEKDRGLQVVDFISWAIFRKYEFNQSKFYNIIEEKIVTEKYFPK